MICHHQKKHVSELLPMNTDTARTAMADWRAQALS